MAHYPHHRLRHGQPYVAAMKGVILSICPAATIVDLWHDIPPQDIRRGPAAGRRGRLVPAGDDPRRRGRSGRGDDRAIVYARIGRQQFVAPDNGLLSRLRRDAAGETDARERSEILAGAFRRRFTAATSSPPWRRSWRWGLTRAARRRRWIGLRCSTGPWPAPLRPHRRGRNRDRRLREPHHQHYRRHARRPADRPPSVRCLQHLRDVGHLPHLCRAAQRNAGGPDRFRGRLDCAWSATTPPGGWASASVHPVTLGWE